MYYSLIDMDIIDFETQVRYVCNCGFNSKSKNEIKENILRYLAPNIESSADYMRLENSSLEDILKIYHLKIYEHKKPLAKFICLSDAQENERSKRV